MNPSISVVVPMYNVEDYIVECVQSLIRQTHSSFEVIIVNDGSTDQSKKRCQQVIKNERHFHLVDRLNGGLSAARNTGLEHAKGEYITFVDSDDLVERDYLQHLIHLIQTKNADIAQCGFLGVDQENGKDAGYDKSFNVVSFEEYMKWLIAERFPSSSSVCAKLFHKNCFSKVRFPVGRICEDMHVSNLIFMKKKTIAISNERKYYYRLRETSIMNAKDFLGSRQAALAEEFIVRYRIAKRHYPQLKEQAQQKAVTAAISAYALLGDKDCYRNRVSKVSSFFHFLRSERDHAMKNKELSVLYKLLLFAMTTKPEMVAPILEKIIHQKNKIVKSQSL